MRQPAFLIPLFRGPWQLGVAGLAALAIFLTDMLTPLQGAVAVLYTAVVLLVASVGGRNGTLLAGGAGAGLAAGAFLVDHGRGPVDDAAIRFGVSLVAIGMVTLLSCRDRATRATLAEQARMLELTHDTVIIRDADQIIRYWNDGAEQLYGWRRKEAVGQTCQALLRTQYPADTVARDFDRDGKWSGEVTRLRRDGTPIVLASRWLQRRDERGRPAGIIETSVDLTDQHRADAERRRSEERYQTIFNAAGFAIWESDWSDLAALIRDSQAQAGPDLRAWFATHPEILRQAAARARIRDANAAAVALFGVGDRKVLIGRSMVAHYTPVAEAAMIEVFVGMAGNAEMVEGETQFRALDGRTVDVVLRVTRQPDDKDWTRVWVMALDVTERNEAQARLARSQAELAHVARVTMLGQLAASIAHEVNQPLSALITYAKSGQRWLAREAPAAGEVADCLDHVVTNGSHAAAVIARIRSLARKGTPQAGRIDLVLLTEDSLALVRHELQAGGIAARVAVAPGLPPALGDKVQVQQVLVNLLINAIQAMASVAPPPGTGGPRDLTVMIGRAGDLLEVGVRDSGPGIVDIAPERMFDPFITTKSDGLGMGLSICRSIIEQHGGRMSACNNPDAGAMIAFTLPTALDAAANVRAEAG